MEKVFSIWFLYWRNLLYHSCCPTLKPHFLSLCLNSDSTTEVSGFSRFNGLSIFYFHYPSIEQHKHNLAKNTEIQSALASLEEMQCPLASIQITKH